VDRSKYSDAAWDRLRRKWERRFSRLSSADESANHALVRQLLGELSPHMDILSAREMSRFHREVSGVSESSVVLETPVHRRLPNFEQVRIKEFTALTQREVVHCLEESYHAGISGVIIDLRGNDGGQLNAAVNMAALFLPPGTIVAQLSFGYVVQANA
jgi:carboxyl-terminal processing protease